MGTIVDTKESRLAQNCLLKSKEAFAAKIAKNKVMDIDISGCVCDETCKEAARFNITGSVETSSPTGKPRTYRYDAVVDVNGKDCKIADLKVSPLEI